MWGEKNSQGRAHALKFWPLVGRIDISTLGLCHMIGGPYFSAIFFNIPIPSHKTQNRTRKKKCPNPAIEAIPPASNLLPVIWTLQQRNTRRIYQEKYMLKRHQPK